MSKFKPYRREEIFLFPPAIQDFVPEGHLARVVDEIVEGLDTRKVEEKYNELGQNTYHPKIMIKLLFYGYATGSRSGRKISSKCESDLAFIYLSQMYHPDFRTINDFRKNNLAEIESYFIGIVRMCKELGMVKAGEIIIDGTKIRANASSRKTKDRAGYEKWLEKIEGQIKAILEEAKKIDEEEDREYGNKRGDELPEELRNKEKLREKIKEIEKDLKNDKEKINLTDKDCKFMKERQGTVKANYNCQVSTTEGQVIIGAEVTNESNDRGMLREMVEQTEENVSEEIKDVIADSGYSSYENYEYLDKEKKVGYIPDQYYQKDKKGKYNKEENKYHWQNFQYDKMKDVYRCPEGKELKLMKKRITKYGKTRRKQKIYKCKDCPTCLRQRECTRGKYRTLSIELRENLMKEMRARLNTERGIKKYKKRMYLVEPIFGNIKYNLGYRNFLLRSLSKVRGEFKLMCIAHNLKKIHLFKVQPVIG